MAQVNAFLRRGEGRYFHYCPGCDELHQLPDSWQFDGNLEKPTFSPSFKHGGKQTVQVNGKWTGEWVRDAAGKPIDRVCHYFLRAGELQFLGDCTHKMKNMTVPLPKIPDGAE